MIFLHNDQSWNVRVKCINCITRFLHLKLTYIFQFGFCLIDNLHQFLFFGIGIRFGKRYIVLAIG